MQVSVFDRLTRNPVASEIAAMTEYHFQVLQSSWVSAFQQRYYSQERDEDFLMWKTGQDCLDQLILREGLRSFALIAEENLQGVLLLKRESLPSRLEPLQSLVYVHYLATAPWNRPDQRGPGWLRGVGTLLMAWAVQESQNMGCHGRLGLHSLRGSDNFYDRLGLHNLGHDPARRGMKYFELCCSKSAEFAEAVKPSGRNIPSAGPAPPEFD
jgi:hypothetical protein